MPPKQRMEQRSHFSTALSQAADLGDAARIVGTHYRNLSRDKSLSPCGADFWRECAEEARRVADHYQRLSPADLAQWLHEEQLCTYLEARETHDFTLLEYN